MQDGVDDGGRCKTTGRFKKGFSGRQLAKRDTTKAPAPMLPHEVAGAILAAADQPIEIRDRDGKLRRLPAIDVVLRQLAASAAKGDKASMRLFTNAITEAAKTIHAHQQRQFDRLGRYLRSLDEGAPWPLDPAEAALYQDLADQAGLNIVIKPSAPSPTPPPVRADEVDGVMSDHIVRTAIRNAQREQSEGAHRALVRRILEAHRAQNVASSGM